MSKRSTYRSDQEDFEKYFSDDLSEKERQALESLALEDGFEAEAMEGWEEVPVGAAKADIADLRKRILPVKSTFSWFKIAAAISLLVVASALLVINLNQSPQTLADNAVTEESDLKQPPPAEPAPAPTETPEPETSVDNFTETFEETPVIHEQVEEDFTSPAESNQTQTTRVEAPVLEARPQVAATTAPDPETSDLALPAVEEEALVQVLATEDQHAVRFRPEAQGLSLSSEDFFEVRAKDNSLNYRQIQGKVLDENGQIVANARVALNGTPILAVSDHDGNFDMVVPDSLEAPALVFSSNGFNPLTYDIDDADTFDVVLAEEDQTSSNALQAARKSTAEVDLETDAEEVFVSAIPSIGHKKYEKYLKKNTLTPQVAKGAALKGTVRLLVEIAVSGEILNVEVLEGLGAGYDEEAIKVVEEGPDWLPARLGNNNVESTVEIKVKFD